MKYGKREEKKWPTCWKTGQEPADSRGWNRQAGRFYALPYTAGAAGAGAAILQGAACGP